MSFQQPNQPRDSIAMNQLTTLIQHHQRTKKCFAIQDVYKLIYQSVFGIEHLLNDREAAKSYLERELDAVVADGGEAMLEAIALDDAVVRLNLRPYKFHHGNRDRLFQAMLDSARALNGSKEKFLTVWGAFQHAVMQRQFDFDVAELDAFDQQAQAENYPPMHHSPHYRAANQPAYRVLKRDIAEQLLSSQCIRC